MKSIKKTGFDSIIIAGGKGTRLNSTLNNPKILINLKKNTTLLDLLIDNFKRYKVSSATILAGQNAFIIEKYCNKIKNKNLKIEIIKEQKLLGTAGCLSKLNHNNLQNDLLIIFGDILTNFDISLFYKKHSSSNADVTIFSHPSNHLMDSDILDTDNKNIVKNILFKPHKKDIISNNLGMAGIFFIKKKLLKLIPKNKKFDFSKDFLKLIIKKNYKILSYQSREYCSDIGTFKRLAKGKKDLKDLKLNYLDIHNKIPAIFLDRDGVINNDDGPLKYSNPLNFIKGSLKGLQQLRKSKYLIFLITNQGAIAKGLISFESVIESHKKFEMYLSTKNFYFEKIYFCPHHPVKGYLGENKRYKIVCECRKPKPGLIFKAQKEFNIDLKNSYFIGDQLTDFLVAKNAGIKIIMVKKLSNKLKGYTYKKNLLEAVNYIFQNDHLKNTI